MESFKIKWWQYLLMFGIFAYEAWKISRETDAKEIIYLIEFWILFVTIFIGKWLNFIAVRLNGNRMPVFYFWFQVLNLNIKVSAIENDKIHSTLDKNTKAKFLCDIFPVVWFGLNGRLKLGMASAGDLIQFFAIFVALVISVRHSLF